MAGDAPATPGGAVRAAFLLATGVGVYVMAASTGFAPVLLVPVAITAIPLVVDGPSTRRTARLLAAALLLGWVLVSIASVGLLYLPSVLLIALSATR